MAKTPPLLFDGLPADAGQPSKGHGWQSEQVIIGTHTGSHIDAALHFDPESAQDAAHIPLDQCWGSALLLDMRKTCRDNHASTADDLDEAVRRTGQTIRGGDIILINTDHMQKYAYPPNTDAEK